MRGRLIAFADESKFGWGYYMGARGIHGEGQARS